MMVFRAHQHVKFEIIFRLLANKIFGIDLVQPTNDYQAFMMQTVTSQTLLRQKQCLIRHL